VDVRKLYGEQMKLTRSESAVNTQEMADTRRRGRRLVAKAEFEVTKDLERSDCCARAEGYKRVESRATCKGLHCACS
jgi:hypothetical protein